MMEYGTVSETQTKEKDDTVSILSMLFRGRCRTHAIGGKWPSCSGAAIISRGFQVRPHRFSVRLIMRLVMIYSFMRLLLLL